MGIWKNKLKNFRKPQFERQGVWKSNSHVNIIYISTPVNNRRYIGAYVQFKSLQTLCWCTLLNSAIVFKGNSDNKEQTM